MFNSNYYCYVPFQIILHFLFLALFLKNFQPTLSLQTLQLIFNSTAKNFPPKYISMAQDMNCILVIWILGNLVAVSLGRKQYNGKGKHHCKLDPTIPRIIGGHEATPRKN